MEINQAFGTRLRDARVQANLTQDELAYRAGLHRTFVSLLERGLRSPTIDTVFKLCKAMGVDSGSFVTSVQQLVDSDDK